MRYLLTLACCAAVLCSAAFADTVVLAGAGGAQSRLSGEIVEYTGVELRLRQAGGSESSIPAERVASIETAFTPDHTEANRLLAEGKHAEALPKFLSAAPAEKRQWAQRLIFSRAVRCYSALNQHEQAGKLFLLILRNDPATQYFDTIPLSWQAQQPPPALELQATTWLDGASPPAARLLGASWLLPTGKRNAAVDALKQLAAGADVRVAALAKTQLWRAELVTATAADVAGWRTAIERLPGPLRAGPYLTLGRAYARLGESEEAALTLMRVPILHSDDHALAAAALVAAADELGKLGRRNEALGLYREAAAAYEQTAAGVEAKARLAESGNN